MKNLKPMNSKSGLIMKLLESDRYLNKNKQHNSIQLERKDFTLTIKSRSNNKLQSLTALGLFKGKIQLQKRMEIRAVKIIQLSLTPNFRSIFCLRKIMKLNLLLLDKFLKQVIMY